MTLRNWKKWKTQMNDAQSQKRFCYYEENFLMLSLMIVQHMIRNMILTLIMKLKFKEQKTKKMIQ